MRLLIIRHGDPDYANDTLTEKGWAQARLLGDRLAGEHIDKIYCSPLGRAQDTAKPTVERIGLQPEIREFLREFPAGIKTAYRPNGMCPWEMLPQHWSSLPELFDREAWRTVSPFAESDVPAVYDRVCAGFDELLAEHGYTRRGRLFDCPHPTDETIALFCHQGLGLTLVSYIVGLSLPLVWQTMFLPTSSVTQVDFELHREEPGVAAARVMFVGDTQHLSGFTWEKA